MTVTHNDVLRVRAIIEMPDLVQAQNVYYWQLDDPTPNNPTNAQIETALDTKVTAMYTDLVGSITDEEEVDHIEIERVEWDVDHWETVENLTDKSILVTGSGDFDMIPHGGAGVVTGNTARPQTRARKFLPGLLEAQITESTMGGSMLAAIGAFAVEWLLDQLVTGAAYLVPVVLGQSGASAGLIYPITEAVISSIIGYQRRRKPGVGS